MRKITIPIFLLSAILGYCGCSLFDDSSSGVPDPSLGRILVATSIDSVMTGLTPDQTIEYLGYPDAIGRGDYAGFTHYYGGLGGTHQPAEIEILFGEDFGYRAVQITVNPPYPGKTPYGVGLGSSKKTTRWFLGPPDAEEVHGDWMRLGEWGLRGDVYFSGDSVAMVFQYDSTDHVYRISLGRVVIE